MLTQMCSCGFLFAGLLHTVEHFDYIILKLFEDCKERSHWLAWQFKRRKREEIREEFLSCTTGIPITIYTKEEDFFLIRRIREVLVECAIGKHGNEWHPALVLVPLYFPEDIPYKIFFVA